MFSLLLMAGSNSLFAQDKIFLVNGNEVLVHVTGSTADHVLAKSLNEADSKTYRYPKGQIERIEYENGKVEYFGEKEEKTITPERYQEDTKTQKNETSPLDRELLKEKEKSRPSFKLGINTGANVPLGLYGKSSGYNHGYAKTGNFFNVEASFMHPTWLGMGLNLGVAFNNASDKAVERKWEIPVTGNYESDVSNYGYYYIMIGPQVSLRAEKKLFIDIKLRYGMTFASLPKYEATFTDDNGYQTKVNNDLDTTLHLNPLSFQAGAGIRYNVSERLGLTLSFNYMICPLVYYSHPTLERNVNGKIENEYYTVEVTELASMGHIGIGVFFLFGDND